MLHQVSEDRRRREIRDDSEAWMRSGETREIRFVPRWVSI